MNTLTEMIEEESASPNNNALPPNPSSFFSGSNNQVTSRHQEISAINKIDMSEDNISIPSVNHQEQADVAGVVV